MNPTRLSNIPTTSDSMDYIDQNSGRAIAIFAIVLVVIQFVLEDPPIGVYEMMSLNVLVICSGFLMLTFALELFGAVRTELFNLQATSIRYSGLLLFLGLFFLLLSTPLPDIAIHIFGGFVALVWLLWFLHELIYIFSIQRDEWAAVGKTRKRWVCEAIRSRWE